MEDALPLPVSHGFETRKYKNVARWHVPSNITCTLSWSRSSIRARFETMLSHLTRYGYWKAAFPLASAVRVDAGTATWPPVPYRLGPPNRRGRAFVINLHYLLSFSHNRTSSNISPLAAANTSQASPTWYGKCSGFQVSRNRKEAQEETRLADSFGEIGWDSIIFNCMYICPCGREADIHT